MYSTPSKKNNGSNINKDTGLPVSNSFHARFLAINHLDKSGFKDWLFASGMLFGARAKWWGDGGERSIPHEGIDLKYYRNIEGKTSSIGPETKIPVTFTGTVVAVIDDFLGKSIFIKHTQYHNAAPGPEIHPGMVFEETHIIGNIANTSGRRQNIPCHLHVSAGWIPDSLPLQDINWETIADPESGVILVDPLLLLDIPYTVGQSKEI
jgi:hypothetical protein